MLGLYYLPILYIAHETGLGLEGASKGLKSTIEAGFCSYDEDTEMVWVHEMAAYRRQGIKAVITVVRGSGVSMHHLQKTLFFHYFTSVIRMIFI